jgi:transcriptional regulator with XRE-family HTH domain
VLPVTPIRVAHPTSPEFGVGAKLREARLARGVGVRELARLVRCSASLISQIEQGKANPSVNTLYEITGALGISMDSIFSPHRAGPSPAANTATRERNGAAKKPAVAANGTLEGSIVQHPDTRLEIVLNHGVRWELLTPSAEKDVEFMEVTYDIGASSAARDESVRHNGREYCVIVEGVLHAKVGFETYVLKAGDSLAFDPTIPHRFWNEGTVPMRAIWIVLDRWSLSEDHADRTQ